jgi:hypothetical protein
MDMCTCIAESWLPKEDCRIASLPSYPCVTGEVGVEFVAPTLAMCSTAALCTQQRS